MTDTTSAPDTPAEGELRAVVTSTGGASPPEPGIAPEDQHYVDRVLAMDAIRDVPSVAIVPEGRRFAPMAVTGLPPGPERSEVEAQLHGMTPEQRKAKEPELVAATVRKMLPALRVKIGVGQDALPYHREMVGIGRDYADLERQFDALTDELAAVRGHRTEFDPATGEAKAVPIPLVSEERRRGIVAQQASLLSHMRSLQSDDGRPGYESQRRLKAAMAETFEHLKKLDRQVKERAEAKLMAEQINRDKRIKAQAESIARMNENTF